MQNDPNPYAEIFDSESLDDFVPKEERHIPDWSDEQADFLLAERADAVTLLESLEPTGYSHEALTAFAVEVSKIQRSIKLIDTLLKNPS